MRYVLKKGRFYVSRPGSAKSYTTSLARAAVYATREQAEGNRCPENEHVVSMEECVFYPQVNVRESRTAG